MIDSSDVILPLNSRINKSYKILEKPSIDDFERQNDISPIKIDQ